MMISQFLRLSAALLLGVVISSVWGCTPAEDAIPAGAATQQVDGDHGSQHNGDDMDHHDHDHDHDH